MNSRRLLEIGGLIAGVVMVVFGVVAVFMSFDARQTVRDGIKQEYIVGSADMNPTDIEAAAKESGLPLTQAEADAKGIPAPISLPSCDVAEQPIETGADARCFAEYMRIHALEGTGGLTYAQMGRFVAKANPEDPKGTSDPAAALTDDEGNPVSNAARNTWVNETALSTALNVSYMADNLAVFALVVGVALLLVGIGLVILALAVFGRAPAEAPAAAPAGSAAPAAG
jgi:hypothetical protein